MAHASAVLDSWPLLLMDHHLPRIPIVCEKNGRKNQLYARQMEEREARYIIASNAVGKPDLLFLQAIVNTL